ncbi:MAG: hypothetical protein ACI8QS_001817 [Planctomycetota bacterium]|jgi:hypothetical protein
MVQRLTGLNGWLAVTNHMFMVQRLTGLNGWLVVTNLMFMVQRLTRLNGWLKGGRDLGLGAFVWWGVAAA